MQKAQTFGEQELWPALPCQKLGEQLLPLLPLFQRPCGGMKLTRNFRRATTLIMCMIIDQGGYVDRVRVNVWCWDNYRPKAANEVTNPIPWSSLRSVGRWSKSLYRSPHTHTHTSSGAVFAVRSRLTAICRLSLYLFSFETTHVAACFPDPSLLTPRCGPRVGLYSCLLPVISSKVIFFRRL